MKGVSLSPRSFQQADFTDFFAKAKQAGQVVSWAGAWDELGNSSGAPYVVTELSRTYGYVPLIEAQFFTQSTGKLLKPLDQATTAAYVSAAVAFARKYRPAYLAFGIEINMLYRKSPADLDGFAQLFAEVYDAVKAVSPQTKVFTIFQLEQMKGLNGGLFGGVNDPAQAQWQLIGRFPQSDIVGFTTYPGLVYRNPAEIPGDYYSEIRGHTSKPVAFTEIGWHSAASPPGWESSEAEQVEFIDRFFSLASGLGADIAIWSFLYDQKTIQPFDSAGLLRADGSARSAWDRWVKEP